MARFMVMVEGTVIDGLKYSRGTIVNVPSSNVNIQAFGPLPPTNTTTPLYNIPRLRNTATTTGAGFADLGSLPPYMSVALKDQLGLQQTTGALPPNSTGADTANVIVEPVLPVTFGQYD